LIGVALTLPKIVELSGVSEPTVRDLVRIGVTRGTGNGPFEDGDVQRLLNAAAFLDGGFSVEQLGAAIESRTMSFEFADAFLLEPTERSGRTLGELAAELGEPVERLRAIYGAFGLPLPDDATQLRAAEDELVRAFVAAWRPAADADATIRAARLFGDSARRAAEGWVDLYVEQVSLPAMATERTYEEFVERTIRPAMALVELAPRLLTWLQQRHSDHAMQAVNLELFERDLVERHVIPARSRPLPVVAFTDLVGYTELTDRQGDRRGLVAAATLQDLAERVAARHQGRVVKLLGDGVMFRFDHPSAAVDAQLELRAAVRDAGLGDAHAGVESGALIERDGDVFGRTVNLTARIGGIATAGEVLVGPVAAAILAEGGRHRLAPLGEQALKGFAGPVPVWRVQ
jgi:adenylate cyclase